MDQSGAFYQKALKVRKNIIDLDPENAEFHRDLAVSHYKFYTVYKKGKLKDVAKARQHQLKTHAPLIKMRDKGIISTDDVKYIKVMDDLLKKLGGSE